MNQPHPFELFIEDLTKAELGFDGHCKSCGAYYDIHAMSALHGGDSVHCCGECKEKKNELS